MPLVSAAYIGLGILIAAIPVLLFFDNLVVAASIQLYAAGSLIIIAMGIRPGEARHFFRVIRVPTAFAAVPVLWILFQLLPIAFGGLSGSIWQSASTALAAPPTASISVDPGLTLIALCRFGSLVSIALVTAAVSIDRQRVEKILVLLASAAAVVSLILLASQLGGMRLTDESGGDVKHSILVTIAIIGVILFAVGIIIVSEQYTASGQPWTFLSRQPIQIIVMGAGLLICLSTLVAGDTSHARFAAACGLATIAIVYSVRRLGFGPRVGLMMGCVAILAAAAIIWTHGHPKPGDISLRYMTDASPDVVTIDNRILDAVGLTGSGAGTFSVIGTIYGAQEPSAVDPATFAAQIAVELGQPALWVIVGLAGILVIILARSAFNRGRDYFYPLAAAGVTVAMTLISFNNATLTNPAVLLLVAITLGLGFGQSVGRRP
jgi:hypothetical protein